jgi:hypothetical protein
MTLRIHAICLALNEDTFITELLKSLYPFCSGISVLSQYDRDWYRHPICPDNTVTKLLEFPDPDGKIHLVIRKYRDETAARNHEMLALNGRCANGILTHGVPKSEVLASHEEPDYFLIVDADEIYDMDTFGRILAHLQQKKPRGMRVLGYNYVRTWNRRVPPEVVRFKQFGFVRPGVLFTQRRVVTWNESRLSKVFSMLRLPDLSSALFGFIDCPPEVGVFHHGCWLGDDDRLRKKITTSSHRQNWDAEVAQQIDSITSVFIPRKDLPRNIREGNWPDHYFED